MGRSSKKTPPNEAMGLWWFGLWGGSAATAEGEHNDLVSKIWERPFLPV